MITYNLGIVFVKLSFLLQFLRIFRSKRMRITLWTSLGIVIIYGGWALFSTIFTCWPIDSFWTFSYTDVTKESCLNFEKLYLAHAGLNLGTDVLILALPVPGLKQLMLPRAQKVGLILVFMLGGL